jgi:hypothetical protein
MSTIVRSREPRGHGTALTARAVRVRNFYVRAIAKKRGLREPADAELSELLPDVTLSAAVGWWEQVQRAEGAVMQDWPAEPIGTEWRALIVRAVAIAGFVVFALIAFPGEIAGA